MRKVPFHFLFVMTAFFGYALWAQSPEPPILDDTQIDARRTAILTYITDLSKGPFVGAISGQNCFHGTQILDSSYEKGYRSLVESLHTETGKWVGILGVDYEFAQIFSPEELSRTNKVLIDYAHKGGLITINLAPQNPWLNDESDIAHNPGTWNGPAGSQNPAGLKAVTSLKDLLDPAKPVHDAWMRKLDRVAAALQELRDAGVIVLWRPMQEMNGSWFWWGMKSHPNDPSPYIAVYRHMHDYFTGTKHLSNLIWVYSPNASLGQNNASSWNRTVDWAYPGSSYVDIIAGTAYEDSLTISDYQKYTSMGKPLGMAEYGPRTDGPLAKSGTLDTTKIIARIKKDYPRIAYWVSWHSYPHECWSLISNLNYVQLMNDPAVITRDDFHW